METDRLRNKASTDGAWLRNCGSDCALEVAGGAGQLNIDAASGTFTSHDAIVQSVCAVDINLREDTSSVIGTTLNLVGTAGGRSVLEGVPRWARRSGGFVIRTEAQSVKQYLEIWEPITGDWVPSDCCVPSGPGNDGGTRNFSSSLTVNPIAAGGSALSDVQEARFQGVEEGVGETNGRLTSLEASIIEHTDHGGPGRSCCRGSGIESENTLHVR